LLLSLFIWTKKRQLILGIVGCVVIFFALYAKTLYARQHQCLLAVYSIKNTTLLSFISPQKSFTICDSSDFNNSFDFNLKANMSSLGLTNFNAIPKIALQDMPRINDAEYGIYHSHISYYGKTIAIAGHTQYAALHPLPVDFLIITAQCRQSPQQVLAIYVPQMVILDASLSRSAHRRFYDYLTNINIVVHSVQAQGAFVANVK
jgi:hypothetical protein